MEISAFAVVIHGKGKLHPVTGDWEQLVTVRGYVKAVDAETLILARGQEDWPEKIALERIQTLVLVGSPSRKALDRNSMRSSGQIASKAESSSLELASRDSTHVDGKIAAAGKADYPGELSETTSWTGEVSNIDEKENFGIGERVAFKLVNGALWSTLSAVAGGGGGGAFFARDNPSGIGVAVGVISGAVIGSVAGSTFGVGQVDPHDDFIMSLTGSLVGAMTGILVMPPSTSWRERYNLFWSLVVCPVVGATIASELSRKPTAEIKAKIGGRLVWSGLVLDPRGRMAANATVRF